jgi:hypothetical protein
LLAEEINEFKSGISSFQADTFEALYDKKVKWAKSNNSTIPLPTENVPNKTAESVSLESSSLETLPSTQEVEAKNFTTEAVVKPVTLEPTEKKLETKTQEVKVVLPKIDEKKVEETKIEQPKVDNIKTTPISTPVTEVKKVEPPQQQQPLKVEQPSLVKTESTAVLLKNVPIVEDKKEEKSDKEVVFDVLKAQQTVSKTFLSLGKLTGPPAEVSYFISIHSPLLLFYYNTKYLFFFSSLILIYNTPYIK